MPGTTLSQLGTSTRPSKAWAWAMTSISSAISSRLAREKRMPSWFMARPSQTPMPPNSKGTPPAAQMPCLTASVTAAQVQMTGDDLVEGIGDADERQLHLAVAQAQSPQERPVRRPGYAFGDVIAAKRH